jgi:hypothetical protein
MRGRKMPSKIEEVKVNEKELENLLVENPEAIERSMKILGRQIQTDTGPLDILVALASAVSIKNELKAWLMYMFMILPAPAS